jgi:hypothetical protein
MERGRANGEGRRDLWESRRWGKPYGAWVSCEQRRRRYPWEKKVGRVTEGKSVGFE